MIKINTDRTFNCSTLILKNVNSCPMISDILILDMISSFECGCGVDDCYLQYECGCGVDDCYLQYSPRQ